ncbi:MAG: RdgB/HAM1 family non-canonical purine NTP pyrophosphatase [Candidatus Kryptoniota bacterium]
MKIVLATHNRHKVEEIKNILLDLEFELLSLDNFPEIGEITEDGTTLEENAKKKAGTVYKRTGILSLADDTGLEVDALNGRPGVYSARYSGEVATYEDNNKKLLHELKDIPFEKRTANFRCVISIVGKNVEEIAIGEVRGKILNEARGKNGFGYDPLFLPDGYDLTYAEMDSELKNKLSHRAKALEETKKILRNLNAEI